MRVLVTNDDGIRSPGLVSLAATLRDRGHDVVVAAPERNVSGCGTGIGKVRAAHLADVTEVEMDGIGMKGHAVFGTPGLAVMSAAIGAFGPPPDIVVSGVNAGLNCGRTIIHSGTVGGALTAQTFGISGLAVSLAPSDPWEWATGVSVAVSLTEWMCTHVPPATCVSANVPAVHLDEIEGMKVAELDRFGTFRLASADGAPELLEFELHGTDPVAQPGSDAALVAEGYVTLTPLWGLREAPSLVAPPPAVTALSAIEIVPVGAH